MPPVEEGCGFSALGFLDTAVGIGRQIEPVILTVEHSKAALASNGCAGLGLEQAPSLAAGEHQDWVSWAKYCSY